MLINLGSEQEWFQSPHAKDYQSPATVSYRIGLTDESEELANEMRSLEIDDTHLVDYGYHEEKAFWSNREKILFSYRRKLEPLYEQLAKLLSDIERRQRPSVALRPDAAYALILRGLTLAEELYPLIEEASSSVNEIPHLLRDRPAIFSMPDARRVLSRLFSYAEPVSHLTTCCLEHLSMLLGRLQMQLLQAVLGPTTDEE
ncbi:hypothetical protein MY4038_005262 [Beauveria bassiana]